MSAPSAGAAVGPAMFLALDTATEYPTITLGYPGSAGRDLRVDDRRALSRDIGAMVAGLFASRGLEPAALTGVLVADGPGAFTGLRIGAAFAKGLCRALGVPLFTAPSLIGAAVGAARAAGSGLPLDVEVRYDALRGECYRAVYRVGTDGGVAVLASPGLTLVGDGAWQGATVRASERDASAAMLLGLMGRPGGPAAVPDAGRWEPAYGRLAEAESRRLARERDAAGR